MLPGTAWNKDGRLPIIHSLPNSSRETNDGAGVTPIPPANFHRGVEPGPGETVAPPLDTIPLNTIMDALPMVTCRIDKVRLTS
jgi:hypothetical protein